MPANANGMGLKGDGWFLAVATVLTVTVSGALGVASEMLMVVGLKEQPVIAVELEQENEIVPLNPLASWLSLKLNTAGWPAAAVALLLVALRKNGATTLTTAAGATALL